MNDQAFARWLIHRRATMGLGSSEALSRASGLPLSAVEHLAATGSMSGLGRSGRAWLARALKVSLRELEAVASGRLSWIEDRRRVDLDRPLSWGHVGFNSTALRLRDAADGSGIPILAEAMCDGSINWFESETPPRLPLRLEQTDAAFAVAVIEGCHEVFVPVLPVELRAGDRVLLTLADGSLTGVSVMGELQQLDAHSCRVSEQILDLASVLRCARRIAAVSPVGMTERRPAAPLKTGGAAGMGA